MGSFRNQAGTGEAWALRSRAVAAVLRKATRGLAAAALVALMALLLACERDPSPDPIPTPPVPPPAPNEPGVAGLPPLVSPGTDAPPSGVAIDDYFSRFGGPDILEPDTDELREDVVAALNEELVGKRVTWDGYLSRVRDAPSGRVMVVITREPEESVDSAIVRLPASWNEHVKSYAPGTPVRVVGVFDKVVGVFPSIAGISIEPLPEAP